MTPVSVAPEAVLIEISAAQGVISVKRNDKGKHEGVSIARWADTKFSAGTMRITMALAVSRKLTQTQPGYL